jgi:hypothetical protein
VRLFDRCGGVVTAAACSAVAGARSSVTATATGLRCGGSSGFTVALALGGGERGGRCGLIAVAAANGRLRDGVAGEGGSRRGGRFVARSPVAAGAVGGAVGAVFG